MSSAGYPFKVPHVARAVEEIEDHTGLTGNSYPNHDDVTNSAEYAADFWSTSKAKHDEVFPWLRENAVRLGITYVISWCRIWSVARSSEGVRRYRVCDLPDRTPSQRHTNHIHVSFSTKAPKEEDMPLSDSDIDKVAKRTVELLLHTDNLPAPAESPTASTNKTWKGLSFWTEAYNTARRVEKQQS